MEFPAVTYGAGPVDFSIGAEGACCPLGQPLDAPLDEPLDAPLDVPLDTPLAPMRAETLACIYNGQGCPLPPLAGEVRAKRGMGGATSDGPYL